MAKGFAKTKIAVTFATAFEKQRYKEDDSVAQQVEHIPFKDGVLGSNPSWVTKGKRQFTDKSGKSLLNMTVRRLFYLFLFQSKDNGKPNLTLNSVLNRYDGQERKNRTDFLHKSL